MSERKRLFKLTVGYNDIYFTIVDVEAFGCKLLDLCDELLSSTDVPANVRDEWDGLPFWVQEIQHD